MKEVTLYVANDGKKFESKYECEMYEDRIKSRLLALVNLGKCDYNDSVVRNSCPYEIEFYACDHPMDVVVASKETWNSIRTYLLSADGSPSFIKDGWDEWLENIDEKTPVVVMWNYDVDWIYFMGTFDELRNHYIEAITEIESKVKEK